MLRKRKRELVVPKGSGAFPTVMQIFLVTLFTDIAKKNKEPRRKRRGINPVDMNKKTRNGYAVLAVDGNKVEITNPLENWVKYITIGNEYTECSARVIVNGRFDVMDDFFFDLKICNVSNSEAGTTERNLKS